MFTRRTSAKAEGKGKTQDHYRQKPPGSCLYCRLRAGFFPGPSWPHPEPPDHYRFLHISSGDTAPHYAFCARAHSLMESSVWHGREQEATNSLQDWSIKATIKVLGRGGVGEETLFQKGSSPTKHSNVPLLKHNPLCPYAPTYLFFLIMHKAASFGARPCFNHRKPPWRFPASSPNRRDRRPGPWAALARRTAGTSRTGTEARWAP